jgi:ubiquitin-conjugating enzyme E2 variant
MAVARASEAPTVAQSDLRAVVDRQFQKGSGDTPIGLWSGSTTQYGLVAGHAVATVGLVSALHLHAVWQYPIVFGLAYAGYQLADLGAGVIHCLLDGYGSPRTPIIGGFLRTFKEHHTNALVQARASVPYLMAPFTLLTMPLMVGAMHLPVAFWAIKALAVGFGIGLPLAGIAHKYSHLRDNVPRPVRIARWLTLLLRPNEHDRHHKFPNHVAFGQLTGQTNAAAERVGFYSGLQRVIYRTTGAVHQSWLHPKGGYEAMVAALGPDPGRHPKLPTAPSHSR